MLSLICKSIYNTFLALASPPFSIAGVNFVVVSAGASGRPSVINMSLGDSASLAIDNAVTAVRNQIELKLV